MFHFSPRNALLPSAALAILLGLTACGGDSSSDPVAITTPPPAGSTTPPPATTPPTTPPPTTPPPTAVVEPTRAMGLTDQRASTAPGTVRLVGFNIATPSALTTDVVITAATGPANAFATGEWIYGMDFRPVDGVLWGLTNRNRLYTIDPATGVATFRVALTGATLDGSTSISADFNPVADRLRVVTFVGQNLSINVATGATTTETPVAPIGGTGFSFVAGVAYSNSFAGAQTATTLYTVNNQRDDLSTQTPPASGTQTLVGALGVAITEVQGFDIGGSTNQLALGALRTTTTGPHSLYNINLSTGAATLRPVTAPATAVIGGTAGLPLVDIAIVRP